MRFAAVACSRCRGPWAVELRHATASCPHCHAPADLGMRTRLWQGDDAREAQAAVARHRAVLAGGSVALQAIAALEAPRLARHDSPLDAAAARAVGIVNKSARAEAVALWLTRLAARLVPHDELVQAMERAGLERERAEAEVMRMLAMDVLMEPRAGHYRMLGS